MAVEVWDGVSVSSPAQRTLLEAYSYFPRADEIYITSATRNDPGSFHDWASQMALDVGFGGATVKGAELGRAFTEWIWPVRRHFAEIIFRDLRTTREYGIKWGWPMDFGDGTYAAHENHVHTAASLAGAQEILEWAKKQKPKPPPKPPAPKFTPNLGAIL